ncbi:hypothetical protein PP707_04530 [Acetobacter pasteurianus]|nr:hypothetical protein [Acetobacter pasteurianus]
MYRINQGDQGDVFPCKQQDNNNKKKKRKRKEGIMILQFMNKEESVINY